MEMKDLIHKLEKARTKDDIEALGKEHLGIDVDKRKSKEIIRAELLGEAEARAAIKEGQPQSPDEDQDSADSHDQENVPAPSNDDSGPSAKPVEEVRVTSLKHSKAKMARNRKTGRVMAWTAAMAKMSHMEEL